MRLQELDEAEIEDARRRRQQLENDDSEMCATSNCHLLTSRVVLNQTACCGVTRKDHAILMTRDDLMMFAARYDEFGRIKKKFRGSEADRKAREEAALARLHGTGSGVRLTFPLYASLGVYRGPQETTLHAVLRRRCARGLHFFT